MEFELQSDYKPAGDQPKAIASLVEGLRDGEQAQTLLGVTGSGKTFTVANVIAQVQRPALVIAHNKTLAAQLCSELRHFFPKNAVEYFVSYYDYYQPEAYNPRRDIYIEKEAQINEEIDRLRHHATQSLLTRRDVIVVSSVSCIYNVGSPEEYAKAFLHLRRGMELTRDTLLRRCLELLFERSTGEIKRGTIRVQGEIAEIIPVSEEVIYRVELADGLVERLTILDATTRRLMSEEEELFVWAAKHYVTPEAVRKPAIAGIRAEMMAVKERFEAEGRLVEADRIYRRTLHDLALMDQTGFCPGIENYSRWFDGRTPGEPPHSLLEFFPKDFLTIIDESHVTLSQIGGMYAGDASRKQNLINYGFRLPSAADNRPLRFAEFESHIGQRLYVSATPGEKELTESARVVEQIIRPTGLVDPEVLIRPITPTDSQPGQVDDALLRIRERLAVGERVLLTTLTKKMAEDVSRFFQEQGLKVGYIHSDIETLDRVKILTAFRKGEIEVIVGVNLLREGLDLPEVSLVLILDADKEGFLRSETSLIQTIGRAARHVRGTVVLYADVVTGSIHRAVKETERRRALQTAYNEKHGITPRSTVRAMHDIGEMLGAKDEKSIEDILALELTASPKELEEVIDDKRREMKAAARELQFELAALLRDEITVLEKELAKKTSKKKKYLPGPETDGRVRD